jgi:hypothetical protein
MPLLLVLPLPLVLVLHFLRQGRPLGPETGPE